MDENIIDYLRAVRLRCATATYQRKQQMAEAFSHWCTDKNKGLAQMTKCDVEKYLLSHAQWCHETRIMNLQVIKELYEFLRAADNPAASIVFRPHPRKKFKLPTRTALQRALADPTKAPDDYELRNALMVELAYGSGLRKGELERLDIEDIDFTAQTAYINGKGGSTRIIPLTSKSVELVRAWLQRRQAQRGPLFTSPRTRRRLGGLRIWQVFKERTGCRPHLFRHACASHMLQNGCNLRIIQELLGHRYLTTTCQYTHINKEELRRVIQDYHPQAKEQI